MHQFLLRQPSELRMMANQNNEAYVIDIDDLVTSMTKEFPGQINDDAVNLPLLSKIKFRNRDGDQSAYQPNLISIGPYHHGTHAVQTMQRMKWSYLNYILELNTEKKLADYIEAIRGLQKQVRSYYADEISMETDSFLKMLLLDRCFVLLTLHGLDEIATDFNREVQRKEVNQIYMEGNKEKMRTNVEVSVDASDQESIQNFGLPENLEENSYHLQEMYTIPLSCDLFLFENQIPFIVVAKIHEIVAGGKTETSLLVENVVESMKYAFDCFPEAIKGPTNPQGIKHLLHLCHMCLKPSQRITVECQNDVGSSVFHNLFHSSSKLSNTKKQISFECQDGITVAREMPKWLRATEYHRVGIKFKRREICPDNPHSLLDIKFCNNDTLEIPTLTFDQHSACLFQNLIAFEQTCPQHGNYISAYFIFWSQIASTPDDVALLSEKGILVHHVSSDTEISRLFMALVEGISLDPDREAYLKSLCQIMESLYQAKKSKLTKFFSIVTSKLHGWTQAGKWDLPRTQSSVNS